MNQWEKETFYVKRDARTGAILRLEEVMPHEYMIEEENRFKQAYRESREKSRSAGGQTNVEDKTILL